MTQPTSQEQKYAVEAFESMVRKLTTTVASMNGKKAIPTNIATAQKRLDASKVALNLLQSIWQGQTLNSTPEELKSAQATLQQIKPSIEKLLPKFAVGTAQHTIATRRLAAFALVDQYIEELLTNRQG